MAEKSFTLADLATLTQSKLVGDSQHIIKNVADLESANNEEASFLSNPRYTNTRYENAMQKSSAGVIFIAPTVSLVDGKNFLINEDPTLAFQKTIEAIRGESNMMTGFSGIHPTAVIHETCKIGKDVVICPNAVIDAETTIGDNTFVATGVYIGPNCTIGNDCIIHPNVSVSELCHIGNRVILQSGAVIGAAGFGYATDNQGKHTKLNHIGNVVIEDDVEVGANTTIDRARFTTTRIGRGTKIDNLVIVAHNVKIGQDNLIAGQSGIAGSTETGRCVVIAGQTGVDGHIKLCDGVIVSGKSGVTKSLTKPGPYGGFPAIPMKEHSRNLAYVRKISSLVQKIKKLEAKLS